MVVEFAFTRSDQPLSSKIEFLHLLKLKNEVLGCNWVRVGYKIKEQKKAPTLGAGAETIRDRWSLSLSVWQPQL